MRLSSITVVAACCIGLLAHSTQAQSVLRLHTRLFQSNAAGSKFAPFKSGANNTFRVTVRLYADVEGSTPLEDDSLAPWAETLTVRVLSEDPLAPSDPELGSWVEPARVLYDTDLIVGASKPLPSGLTDGPAYFTTQLSLLDADLAVKKTFAESPVQALDSTADGGVFTLSGNDAVYTAGFVGIGTDAPDADLTVDGAAHVTAGLGVGMQPGPSDQLGVQAGSAQTAVRALGFPPSGGESASVGSTGLYAAGGGNADTGTGGTAIIASGGSAYGTGGTAIIATGGFSEESGNAGTGVKATGGYAGFSTSGGVGLHAIGGSGELGGQGRSILADGDVAIIGQLGIGSSAFTPSFDLHVDGSAGKPGGGSWSVASDARLKTDVVPLEGALEQLLQLRGVRFRYLDPEAIGELPGVRVGLVAQEVEPVFPDWVSEGSDGYKRLTVRGSTALFVEALRELRAERDQEVADLREQLTRMSARVEALEHASADTQRDP